MAEKKQSVRTENVDSEGDAYVAGEIGKVHHGDVHYHHGLSEKAWGGLLALLVVVVAIYAWLPDGEPSIEPEPKLGLKTDPTPSETPPSLPEEKPPPPIELEAIQPGTVGIAAVNSSTGEWDNEVARILLREVRKGRPKLKPVLVKESLYPFLMDLGGGDFSKLPGAGQAPNGLEYLFISTQSHGDHPGAIDNFPTVSVACEMTLVATSEPKILYSQSFNHSGKATSRSGALSQAFERCVNDSIHALP